MAEWLKALVSKTGIPFTGYRGFESPFFRKGFKTAPQPKLRCCFTFSPPLRPLSLLSFLLFPLSSLLFSYPPSKPYPSQVVQRVGHLGRKGGEKKSFGGGGSEING